MKDTQIDLTPAAQQWQADVIRQFRMKSAGELETVQQAAICLSRAEACRESIQKHGMFIATGNGGVKAHPACREERMYIQQFLQACRQLQISAPKNTEVPT